MDAGFEFRLYPWYRAQILIMFAVFAGFALVLVARLLTGRSDHPMSFDVFWLAALGWNGYWFLLRFAWRLAVANGEFHWQAPLSSGSTPLGDLRRARPSHLGSNVEVFELVGRRPVLVFASHGLQAFVDELKAVHPGVETRVGWQARLLERGPRWLRGRSGFRRLP